MKLQKKTIHAILILILSSLFIVGHDEFRGIENLNPLRAIKIGGTYLILYAALSGAIIGLMFRVLSGSLAEKQTSSSRFNPPFHQQKHNR